MSIRTFAETMKWLYQENDYPSDRLIRDQDALAAFACEFNSRTGGRYSAEDVAAEIERIRKDKSRTGGLPRLGRSFRGPQFVLSRN